MDEKIYCVYIHTNKINGKKYIGQTSQNPTKRWDCGRGYLTSPRFYNAIQKYGWENFEHEIIATNLTLEEANSLEDKLINEYKTQDDQYGYNIKGGGSHGAQSEETKRKIGEANHISLKGKPHSKEWSEKMSEMFTGEGNPFYGHHHTEETKRKISESRKGKYGGENHPMYGKKHTEEALQKISENRRSKGGKKVRCINTGEVFDTMMDAARWCGLKTSTSIGQICNKTGKRRTAGRHPITGEKLEWEFYDEE